MATAETPLGSASWRRVARIEDYDGSPYKRDSETEGETCYAVTSYLDWRYNLRGSAYTTATGTLVDAENVAAGRYFGALLRWGDKMRLQRKPSTASDALQDWVEILDVHQLPSDTEADLRARCAAKYRAKLGPTRAVVDGAIATLLGDYFEAVWRFDGDDIATPPPLTYWPGVTPGPATYDLGGGAWMSERDFLMIGVKGPQDSNLTEYMRLMNQQLFELCRRMLPAYVTCDWGVDADGGFVLDVDELDFGCVT